MTLSNGFRLAIQIADALDKAHRHGVVHRDLKPANIMLSATGVKLLDFGVATRRTRVRGTTSEILTEDHEGRITGEGAILGTLEYMAPEQLEGKEADGRTDIFAFGALVYEMVTGGQAFSMRERGWTDRRDPPRRAASRRRVGIRYAARPGSDDFPMPIQGSRRAVADGCGPSVSVAFDRSGSAARGVDEPTKSS
jgi:serine/threonine protein kinase